MPNKDSFDQEPEMRKLGQPEDVDITPQLRKFGTPVLSAEALRELPRKKARKTGSRKKR